MSITAQPTQYIPSVPRGWRRTAGQIAAGLAAVMREMSFVEHLEELRRRLIWSVVFVSAAFGLCWFAVTDLLDIASAPIRAANPGVTLALSRLQDIVGLNVKVTLVASLFVSAPFVLAQAWLFIAPGLYPHERRYAVPFVLSSTILFLAGGAFGYFIAFPAAVGYLLDWIVESHLTPIIDISEYFNLLFMIIVALGLSFQIPAIVFVLSRIGLVDARFLAAKLKYAVFGCVVAAAILTPTTDPGNMLLLAGPMIVLYCVGIVVAGYSGVRALNRKADVRRSRPVAFVRRSTPSTNLERMLFQANVERQRQRICLMIPNSPGPLAVGSPSHSGGVSQTNARIATTQRS
jgi:sec-independent protein translocase protein TatC